LTAIVQQLQEFGSCPPQLQELLAVERSRKRFTSEDIATAATTLGFGIGDVLNVEYKEDIQDQFVENAWKESVKRSWHDLEHGSETYRLVDEAFRILAESRGSIELKKIFENRKNRYMTPYQAYNALEVAKDVDDFVLITVYNMRVRQLFQQTSIWC
jgi:ubiquitin carboxyl-terminal hydrolase 25/28